MSKEVLEYCQDRIKEFSNVNLDFCNGYSILNKDNKFKFSNMTDEIIEKWYNSHERKHTSWLYNFICAINSKKITMIENDFLPETKKGDGDKESMSDTDSYFMRYVMTNKCKLHSLVFDDDDPTTIYFYPEKYKEAHLLFDYHSKRLHIPEELSLLKNFFNIFQGILLGYEYFSIFEFCYIDFYPFFKKRENIEKSIEMNRTNLKTLYMKYYTTKNLNKFKDEYEKIDTFIKSQKSLFKSKKSKKKSKKSYARK